VNFQVETPDTANAEIQAAYLRLMGWKPEFAERWLEGLLRQIETLEISPRMHPVVDESEVIGREVRRILYRNGSAAYRILFSLFDFDDDGEEDTVRVLHVRHGARQPFGQAAEEN